MTARWRETWSHLGLVEHAQPIPFRNHYKFKNIPHLKSHYCLLRCPPHCHVYCALCYIIVGINFSLCCIVQRQNSSSLTVINRLICKCKNEKRRMEFFSSNYHVVFSSPSISSSLLKFCVLLRYVRRVLLNKERSSLFNLRFLVFSFFIYRILVLRFTRSMITMDNSSPDGIIDTTYCRENPAS